MAAPKITTTIKDVNPETVGLTGNSSKLIRFHSWAKASMTITPNSGAIYLDTISITHGGKKKDYEELSGDELSCSYIFENVTNNLFMFYAEDEYGNGTTVNDEDTEIIPYVHLTCNIAYSKLEVVGTTAAMRLSCTGNYFNGSFGAKSNSLTVEYRYSGSDRSSGEGTMIVTKSGNTYSAYADLGDLNHEATYTFTITATDKLEEVSSSEEGVTSVPLFHWGKNDFTFEVPVNFNGVGTTRFKGDLQLKGDENYGNTLYFGDSNYCYIKEETDDDMTIKADNIALIAEGGITINGSAIYGTWTPKLGSSAAVDDYDVQEGWYQKLGNVVTIGWNLKADINSGYEEKTLVIKNFPFTPSVNAFGGGVAFGVYTESDFIFEGWGIVYDDDVNSDTYKQNIIAARLQRCEKASSGNLQISRKCCYPKGGGTVTLAGTICYMTDD